GTFFPTINPATEEPLAEVAEAGPEDVDLAVKAAREAQEQHWRGLPGAERAKYIYRIPTRPRARGPSPGGAPPAPSGPSTSTGSRARSRSAGASSPSWSRWTAANPSRSRAML